MAEPGTTDVLRLLTWFGTIVCSDLGTGELCHRPWSGSAPASAVAVRLGRDPGIADARLDRVVLEAATPPGAWPAVMMVLDAEPVDDAPRAVHLRRDGQVMSAEHDGRVNIFREQAGGWETFLVLSDAELRSVGVLLRGHWVERGRWDRAPAPAVLEHGSSLRIGERSFRLGENPQPFDCARSEREARRATLWTQNWRPTFFETYRPLVYYTVFGAPGQFEMLRVSLDSLYRQGYPHGDILVITDKDREALESYVPEPLRDRLHVFAVPARDFFDFCVARYRVVDWAQAVCYRPLLYVDTDVVFDRPPDPMLRVLAGSDRMSAQREPFSTLAEADSVGSELLAEDEQDVGDAAGFNSGIISMPEVAAFADVLRLVPETMRRVADTKGRHSLRCFDQAVANYVAFRTASFDLDIISPYVRYFVGDHYHGGDEPRGFVHFWGGRTVPDKIAMMRRYLSESPAES